MAGRPTHKPQAARHVIAAQLAHGAIPTVTETATALNLRRSTVSAYYAAWKDAGCIVQPFGGPTWACGPRWQTFAETDWSGGRVRSTESAESLGLRETFDRLHAEHFPGVPT